MIGTGDKGDSDNYDKQSKSIYLLGYIFIGLLIVVLAMFYAWTIEQYKDKKKDGEEDEEDEEDDKKKKEEKKKDDK